MPAHAHVAILSTGMYPVDLDLHEALGKVGEGGEGGGEEECFTYVVTGT